MSQSLSNLALGSLIKFGKYSVNGETPQDIIWRVVAKGHQSTPAYPSNSVTLMTDKIIDFRAYDAKHIYSIAGVSQDVTNRGYNEYRLSNIDQWLNKDSPAGTWYESTIDTDAPPTAAYVESNAEYYNRPGFLNAFSQEEKNAILDTTIRVCRGRNLWGSLPSTMIPQDITRKVYLPSLSELALDNMRDEGSAFELFATGTLPWASATSQMVNNSLSSQVEGTPLPYWSRSTYYNSNHQVCAVYKEYFTPYGLNAYEDGGVRPVINLPNTLVISDTTDSDRCHTAVWNTAPTAPTTLNVPTIYGGKSNVISWGASTDSDGDTVSYRLECSIDGGAFTTIYSGTNSTYTHTVPFGNTHIQYRVCAVDDKNEYSAYTTSATLTIINNQAPTISGNDGDLGTQNNGVSVSYSVSDSDGDGVTIVETLDGVTLRTYAATLGATNTCSISGTSWLKVLNGSHTLRITATDSKGASYVRTYTFTKNVTALSILTDTMESSDMPTRIAISVTRVIPINAKFKVEVCNNGNDASPTWEDATASVEAGLVHGFANKNKTATSWAVRIKVTVDRNGASGNCYISAIGGNFE